MKKALKYIAIVLISLLVLLLTLPLSIYIPAVQRWGKNEISGYVGRSTGMELSIGKLSLKFPFRLQIDDILLLTSSRDTLLQSSSIQVGVAPAALLRGQVQIQKIALNETLFRFSNSDSTLLLSANIKQFSTQKANVNLKDFHISLPSTRLDGGEITLNLSESSPDTVSAESAPLNWSISVGEIGLSNIHYSMQMKPTIENLDASIQKARLLQGEIDLYGQSVRVSEAIIDKGDYRYYPGSGNNEAEPEENDADTIVSLPWTVQIQKLRLHRNQALYALPTRIPQKGLDFGYLSLDNIEIAIDSLYNRGSEICVPIKQLAFTERSGIAVTRTQGTFTMDSTGISLQKFQMNTALSEISAQIKAGNGIFTQNSQTPVEVRLQAKLAIGDIIRVLPEYDNYTRGLLLSTGFLSNISMNGKLGDLNLEKADISLPGTFVCQATGNVQNLHEADRINGSLQWELRLKNSPVFANVMPDSPSKKIHIPPTRFTGDDPVESPNRIRRWPHHSPCSIKY